LVDLSWLPDGGTGHLHPTQEAESFWMTVKSITGFKNLMEIGFNAGHSSSFLLELFEDINVHSYDIALYDITHNNSKLVKEKYKERFEFFLKDSLTIKPNEIPSDYDILFVDGNHKPKWVSNDLNLGIQYGFKYIVLDDLQNPNVSNTLKTFDNLDVIVEDTYYSRKPNMSVGQSEIMLLEVI